MEFSDGLTITGGEFSDGLGDAHHFSFFDFLFLLIFDKVRSSGVK